MTGDHHVSSESSSKQADPSNLGIAGRIVSVFRDSFIYGGAAMLTTSFSLLTFPILTRHFSTSDYGIIDLFGMVTNLLVIFFVFGQDSAIMRYFYDSKDRSYRSQLISQSLSFQVGLALVLTPIPFMFSDWIGAQISPAENSGTLLRLIFLTAPFEIVFATSCLVARLNFHRYRYVSLTVGVVLMRVLVLISAIYLLDIGVRGIFVVNLLMSIFGCCAGLLYLREWLTFPAGFRILKSLFPFAIPLGLIMMINVVVPISQRLAVEGMIGSDALGQYAAGAKVALLLSLPIAAFSTAWGPFAFSIFNQPDAERTYQLLFRIVVVLTIPMILILDIFGEHILGFLAGSDYLAGTVVILPLACGLAVVFLGSETSIGLAIKKRMVFRLYAFIIYLVSGLIAIVIFGNYFGMLGVAYGTLLGQLLLGASLFLFARRISGISWNAPPVILFCAIFLALGFSRNVIMDSESLLSLVFQALVIVTACLLVGFFLLFAPSDRALALKYVRRLRR